MSNRPSRGGASRKRRGQGGKHRTEPDPVALAVGTRVRELRKELDWTFDAFVGETGLGRGYVSELERGLVVPSVCVLSRIASTLNVTLADLVLGDSPREALMNLTRGLTAGNVADLTMQAKALSTNDPQDL